MNSVPTYSVDQTAKLIRRALKEAFPDVRFHVQRIAGSDLLRTSWTNGPRVEHVRDITEAYESIIIESRAGSTIPLLRSFDHWLYPGGRIVPVREGCEPSPGGTRVHLDLRGVILCRTP